MKQFMKYSLFLLLCSAVFVPRIHSVTTVVPNTDGGATAPATFQKQVQATDFHRPSGTMIFGLAPFASEDALGFASTSVTAGSAGDHIMGSLVPTYTGIAESTTAAGLMAIRNSSIQALAVANDITSPADFSKAKIFFLSSQGKVNTLATSNIGHPLMVITTTAIPSAPNAKYLTEADAGTAHTCYTMTLVAGNAYGEDNNKTYAFVAVKDSAGHDANRGNFATHAGDGVVMVECGDDNYTLTQRSKNAASTLALTTSLAIGKAPLGSNNVGQNGRAPAMCYDETLKRLYVGVNYTTSSVSTRNTGGWGVQILKVDPDTANGTFTNLLQGGVTANGGALVLTGSHIVGVGSTGIGAGGAATVGTRASLTYHNLKVMHTSAGPSTATKFSYLIVNGGNGHGNSTTTSGAAAVSNRVWSVPLVVGQDNDTDGTFANVLTGDYSTVANAAGELSLTNTLSVIVGGGPLPCPATTKPSAMWVDGDAVYCSIDTAASSTVAPGIWQSQACFNRHGQIDHWTEWAKVAPLYLGGLAASEGRISHFAVDAVSTRIWGVDTAKTSLRLTSWEDSSFDGTAATHTADANGLLTRLNTALGNNCTAVCDLNSSSTGWGATTPTRITMFGNDAGKVSFAVTGSATGYSHLINPTATASLATTNSGIESDVIFDYSTTGTLKTTTVLAGNVITCLAYSGWDERASSLNTGYFFAGVENPGSGANKDLAGPGGDGGLYVWTAADLGAGFDTRDVRDFSAPPFRTTGDVAAANARTWQKLDRISGVPAKIVARGGAVYILTLGHQAKSDKIFRLSRQSTGELLNTDFCVTASAGETGSGTNSDLRNVNYIYDFVVTATALDTITSGAESSASTVYGEQLMMLTDDGIYTTTCSIGTDDWNVGVKPANSQLICGWVQMSKPATDTTWQAGFSEPGYTRDPSTFWYERSTQHKDKPNVYSTMDIYQLSRWPLSQKRAGGTDGTNDGNTWGNWAYNPTPFNAFDGTATEPTAFDQEPYLSDFYSDGSRRITEASVFVTGEGNPYKLYSQPYVAATGASTTPSATSAAAATSQWWNNKGPVSHNIYATPKGFINWISPIGSTGKLFAGTTTGVIGLV